MLLAAYLEMFHGSILLNCWLRGCNDAQSYPPLLAFAPKSQLSTMHLFKHMFQALLSFRLLFNTQFVQNTQLLNYALKYIYFSPMYVL